MTKEKIHIRTWPLEKTLDFFGSGVDAPYIRKLNKYGTEEEKSAYIHNRRKETLLNSAVFASLVGGMIGSGYALRELGITHNPDQSAPLEKHGGHHGSVNPTSPGTGKLHTKSGDFHVVQK